MDTLRSLLQVAFTLENYSAFIFHSIYYPEECTQNVYVSDIRIWTFDILRVVLSV
jgi:hypothetical protein